MATIGEVGEVTDEAVKSLRREGEFLSTEHYLDWMIPCLLSLPVDDKIYIYFKFMSLNVNILI